MAKTKNALKILDTMIGDDADLRETVVDATLNARVAQLIYQAREDAGLTQRELAERVGTKQPVIARLEDADYEGHSLSMLQKVAVALGKRLRLSLGAPEEDGSLSVRVAPNGANRKNAKKKTSTVKPTTQSRTIDKRRKRA
jgi:transcriptional regulator with XRE-family HTH domain